MDYFMQNIQTHGGNMKLVCKWSEIEKVGCYRTVISLEKK